MRPLRSPFCWDQRIASSSRLLRPREARRRVSRTASPPTGGPPRGTGPGENGWKATQMPNRARERDLLLHRLAVVDLPVRPASPRGCRSRTRGRGAAGWRSRRSGRSPAARTPSRRGRSSASCSSTPPISKERSSEKRMNLYGSPLHFVHDVGQVDQVVLVHLDDPQPLGGVACGAAPAPATTCRCRANPTAGRCWPEGRRGTAGCSPPPTFSAPRCRGGPRGEGSRRPRSARGTPRRSVSASSLRRTPPSRSAARGGGATSRGRKAPVSVGRSVPVPVPWRLPSS